MDKPEKKNDRSTWAIGGGLLMGIGAGLFYLTIYPLASAGCILMGLGLGLMTASIIPRARA